MDDGRDLSPLHQTIAAALSEFGVAELPCLSTTFLIHDGQCVGQRFLFDGIQAIWLIVENVVRLYDEGGQMLKVVAVGTAEQEKAA